MMFIIEFIMNLSVWGSVFFERLYLSKNVKELQSRVNFYFSFYVLHCVSEELTSRAESGFFPFQKKEQLPGDYIPPHPFIINAFFLNHCLYLFTHNCVYPICFISYGFSAIWSFLRDPLTKAMFLSYLRTPKPFNCDDSNSERSAEEVIINLKLHRASVLKSKKYKNVKILKSKTNYYKRIEASELTETEAEFWPGLNHDNVLSLCKLHTASMDPFFVVQEIEWKNTLDDILYNDRFNKRRNFFHFAIKWSHDILMGIEYLHGKKLFHLDLEPCNIIIDFAGRYDPSCSKAVIANFKFMNKLETDSHEINEDAVGFPDDYRPPECFMKSKVDAEKCDVWGLGIIMLEIFTGGLLSLWQAQYPKFNQWQRDVQLSQILMVTNFYAAMEAAHKCSAFKLSKSDNKERGPWNSAAVWQICMFVTDLLKLNNRQRMTLQDALQHEFVKDVCHAILLSDTDTNQNDEFRENVEAVTENTENTDDDNN